MYKCFICAWLFFIYLLIFCQACEDFENSFEEPTNNNSDSDEGNKNVLPSDENIFGN